jgi:hypothetical protein
MADCKRMSLVIVTTACQQQKNESCHYFAVYPKRASFVSFHIESIFHCQVNLIYIKKRTF